MMAVDLEAIWELPFNLKFIVQGRFRVGRKPAAAHLHQGLLWWFN